LNGTILPISGSNLIFQEVGYSENTLMTLSLRRQAFALFQVAKQIPGVENEISNGYSLSV
jgi:hypothetical protein